MSAPRGYPDKPIRFIVPFAAGGGADSLARAVASGMSDRLQAAGGGREQAGGDAVIGTQSSRSAAPDGYTILFGSNTGMSGARRCTRTWLRPGARLHADLDDRDVSVLPRGEQRRPVKTLRSWSIRARQSRQAQLRVGQRDGHRRHGQLVAARSSTWCTCPTRARPGDAGPPQQPGADDLHHRLHRPHVKDGRVRAIVAVTTSATRRCRTCRRCNEAGFPGLSMRGWAAVFGPAGMPRDVVRELSERSTKR
jgi:hypothetical protein